eukprot:s582_g21.t1
MSFNCAAKAKHVAQAKHNQINQQPDEFDLGATNRQNMPGSRRVSSTCQSARRTPSIIFRLHGCRMLATCRIIVAGI